MDRLVSKDDAMTTKSAAESLLDQLQRAGIDYLFANGGTDFPPLVEAYCRAEEAGRPLPTPLVVPHENAAVAMAHGYYLASGRMQAVMVHVNVGTANAINAVLDASREQIPILLMAGRSPYSEQGHHGTRTRYIHWAQEMFDQAGMLREAVKWDYELHLPDQAADTVNRALEVAQSSPKGPVYLTLPRDVLGAPDPTARPAAPRPPVAPAPADEASVARVADWLKAAERPVIVTANAGRSAEAYALLADLAETHGIPVTSFHQRFNSISSDHPMDGGHDPAVWLKDADVLLVLDCDVPWVPAVQEPPAEARVVHVGEDPVFARYPMRNFRSDLSLATPPETFLRALVCALGPADARAEARRGRIAARVAERKAALAATAEPQDVLTPEYISRVVGEVVGEDAIIVNEYPLRPDHCRRTKPGTYMGLSPAGGLGWGLGAALGVKLAKPEATVVCTMGDGAYIFTNPTACHWVGQAHDLPVLTVVFNNALHGAVRNSTLAMYPGGSSSRTGGRMLADLSPSPAFESLAGSEGFGVRVETVEALRPALEEALAAVRAGRQALVNVICDY